MARRGVERRGFAIDLATVADAAWRVAGAIVLETLAFVVWNVGTRSPLAVLRAMRTAANRPRALATGAVAALVGLIFIAAATVLLLPAIADLEADFVPTELGTLLVALALELLIGNDLRSLTAS